MASLGNLFVNLLANTTGLEQGMSRGAAATQKGAQQMAGSMLRVNGALNSTVMIASQMGLDTKLAMPLVGVAHVATDLAPKLAMAAGGIRAIGIAATTALGPIGLAIAAIGAITAGIVWLASSEEEEAPLIDWFGRLEKDSATAASAVEAAMARVADAIEGANAAAAGMDATDRKMHDLERTAELMGGGMSRGDAEAQVGVERQVAQAMEAQARIEQEQLGLAEARIAAARTLANMEANRLSGFGIEVDMTDEERAAKTTEVARRDAAIVEAKRKLDALDQQMAAAEKSKPFDDAFGPDAMRQQLQGIRDAEQSLDDMEAAAKAAADAPIVSPEDVDALLAEREAIEDAAAAADAAAQGGGQLGDMGFMRSRDMSGAFGTGGAAEQAAAAAVAEPGGALDQIESALGGITVGGAGGNPDQRRLVELTEQMVKFLESIKSNGDEQVLA